MEFTVLSHAGLAVRAGGRTLVCDPWIVGSTYWRSWWNYPPVPRDLVDALRPDAVYLTHLHWDHFQGVSLRRFSFETPVYVPADPAGRMSRDLHDIGFRNVVELAHGESADLWPDLRITSYHFGICPDSALVVEAEGVTMLNANDAKFMGRPLAQILRRHAPIDFVLRSHSSANSRLCYELIDDPLTPVDDLAAYARDFTDFARATGARFAVPFASNHCYLHDETYRFNEFVVTPLMVEDHCARVPGAPAVKVMVSGDSWSSDGGFAIHDNDWFSNREQRIREYREGQRPKLEELAEQERRATVGPRHLDRYFSAFFDALPLPVRLVFRDKPVVWVLTAGDRRTVVETDLYRKTVRVLDGLDDARHPRQIHTLALIMRHCMSTDLFSLLPISKRIRYRVTAGERRYVHLLNRLFNLYERGYLPPRRALNRRYLSSWARRWRELALYGEIGLRLARGRRFRMADYLPPAPASARGPGAADEAPRRPTADLEGVPAS